MIHPNEIQKAMSIGPRRTALHSVLKFPYHYGQVLSASNKEQTNRAVQYLSLVSIDFALCHGLKFPYLAERPADFVEQDWIDPTVGLGKYIGDLAGLYANSIGLSHLNYETSKEMRESLSMLLAQIIYFLDRYIRRELPNDNLLTVLNEAYRRSLI